MLASAMNGANTPIGKNSGHAPVLPSSETQGPREESERHGAGVAHEDARRGKVVREEARATPRRSAAAMAASARCPEVPAAIASAANPIAAMPPARPSEPSMKLKRFVIHTIAKHRHHALDKVRARRFTAVLGGEDDDRRRRRSARPAGPATGRLCRSSASDSAHRKIAAPRITASSGVAKAHAKGNAPAITPRPPMRGVGTCVQRSLVGNDRQGALRAASVPVRGSRPRRSAAGTTQIDDPLQRCSCTRPRVGANHVLDRRPQRDLRFQPRSAIASLRSRLRGSGSCGASSHPRPPTSPPTRGRVPERRRDAPDAPRRRRISATSSRRRERTRDAPRESSGRRRWRMPRTRPAIARGRPRGRSCGGCGCPPRGKRPGRIGKTEQRAQVSLRRGPEDERASHDDERRARRRPR